MSGALILAGIILVTLVLYSVLGGADFGAGFWDLMCAGKRWQQQRDLIASAIHPVWARAVARLIPAATQNQNPRSTSRSVSSFSFKVSSRHAQKFYRLFTPIFKL